MKPSEWVEANVVATDGVKAGSLIKLHPFQRGMMDAITEDRRKLCLNVRRSWVRP